MENDVIAALEGRFEVGDRVWVKRIPGIVPEREFESVVCGHDDDGSGWVRVWSAGRSNWYSVKPWRDIVPLAEEEDRDGGE